MAVSLLAVILCSVPGITASSWLFGHHFKENDPVDVTERHVMPFYNQLESFDYNALPWPCHSGGTYQIHFLRASTRQTVCGEKSLNAAQINQFIDAIDESYQYEMGVDGLPVRGLVGFKQTVDSSHGITSHDNLYFLITHRHFHIKYNSDQIITVNISVRLQPDHYIEIKRNTDLARVQMTYSVQWSSTDIPYEQRLDAQIHFIPNKHQLEAHWLWIMNSSLLVILLTGLLSMILLRTLKNDMARYLEIDDMDQEFLATHRQSDYNASAEFGWKRVKFDVFRAPPYPYLFASVIGIGVQLLLITFVLLMLAVVGYFYPLSAPSESTGFYTNPYSMGYVLYLLTSYISGYVSSRKLKELLGDEDEEQHLWLSNCMSVSCIFAVPLWIAAFVNSGVARYFHADTAMPFHFVFTLFILWMFVTWPLTAFGSYRGRKSDIQPYPSMVKKIARPVPEQQAWYLNRTLSVLISGFLSFLSIYVELHTIFISHFGQKPYTLFGILLITFIILLIVTSFCGILMTYFLLNSGDYHWWWMSILRGACCGLFIMIYSVYYYWSHQMHHSMLTFSVYFSFCSMVGYALSLMLAAVAHISCRWFVIKIYTAIKPE